MQNHIKESQISLPTVHRILSCFSKNDCEVEPVILHTVNTMKSKECVTAVQ